MHLLKVVRQEKVHLVASRVGAARTRATVIARMERVLGFIVIDCLRVVGKLLWG